jgi:hypothetical protein
VERRYSSFSFSTSVLDGGKLSASFPGEGPPVPIEQGAGGGGGRAGLDTEDTGKNPFASAGDRVSIARSSSS